MSDNYIAHVRKDLDDTWATPHSLSDHLKMTAKMAGKFAAKFNSEEWGKAVKMPHAIHGAKLAEELHGKRIGRILSYCIAGHHAGLPDWSGAEGAGQSSLEFQLTRVKDLSEIEQFVLEGIRSSKPSVPPWHFSSGLDMSLWIRMLYSCLVDADFLDTESYMNQEVR